MKRCPQLELSWFEAPEGALKALTASSYRRLRPQSAGILNGILEGARNIRHRVSIRMLPEEPEQSSPLALQKPSIYAILSKPWIVRTMVVRRLDRIGCVREATGPSSWKLVHNPGTCSRTVVRLGECQNNSEVSTHQTRTLEIDTTPGTKMLSRVIYARV